MSAIITSEFRKKNVQKILSEISEGSTKYYLGIGKADPWVGENDTEASVPAPDTSASTILDAKSSLIGLKIIDSASANYMIPRVNIRANRRYKAYDSTNETCFYPTLSGGATTVYPCYAVYNNKIYLCIYNGNTGAGTISNFSGAALIEDLASPGLGTFTDGVGTYRWVYVCNLKSGSTLDISEFVEIDASSTDYSPVPSGAFDGQIWFARIVDNGSGASVPNSDGSYAFAAAIEGDGTGLAGNVTVSGGNITAVTITNHGSGYTKAKLNLATLGLSGRIALSVLPENGVGYDPLKTLPAWYLGVSAKFADTETGEVPVNLSYRQISLIKDPTLDPTTGFISTDDSPSDTSAAIAAADALKWLQVDSPAAYTNGGESGLGNDINSNSLVVLHDTTNGAKGFAVRYDADTDRIYYYQNNSDMINQIPFPGGSPSSSLTVDVDGDGGAVGGITYTNTGNGEYDGTSGEMIFLENRTAITRADSQIEDIRVIIQY